MLDISKFDNSIIITLDELSSYVLAIKQKFPKVNIKLLSMSKAQQMAFGHFVLPNAYQLGIKHINNNYLVIKKWISYLQKGINPKTNREIDQFYNLLNQNNLIITNENYKYLFKNKKVFIIGIDKDNTELKHLIEKLEINQSQISYITTDDLFPEIKVPVTKYSLISLEVKDALYKIIDLIQNKHVSPKDIVICTNNDECCFYLKLFAKELKINLKFQENQTLFDTPFARVVFNHLNQNSINFLDSLKTNDEIARKIIKQVLIDYHLTEIQDKTILKLNYASILKDIPYNQQEENDKEFIIVLKNKYFHPYKHIFYLSLTNSSFNVVSKDNDLLPDKIKKVNYLQDSNELNKTNSNLCKSFLNLSDNLYLSYSTKSINGVEKLSFFYENKKQDNKEAIDYQNNYIEYSEGLAKLWHSHYKKNNRTYRINEQENNVYANFFANKISYYDNSFKPFSTMEVPKKISYSLINDYLECPFKYFCKRVLKLDEFSESTNTKIGSFIHWIIKQVNTSDSFEKVVEKAKEESELKYSTFDKWEKIYVRRYIHLIHQVWNKIHDLKQDIIKAKKIPEFICEKEFTVNFNKKPEYKIHGYIDCVISSKGEDNTLVEIVDYKTGKMESEIKKINWQEFGLGLQLPFYLYLFSNSKDYKNEKVNGLYYEALDPVENFRNWKDLEEKKLEGALTSELLKDSFKFSGQTLNPFKDSKDKKKKELWKNEYQNFFEPNLDNNNFKYIDYSSRRETSFFKNSNDILKQVEKWVEVFIHNISHGFFPISPFTGSESEDEITACKYCEYNDICFKHKNNKRIKSEIDKYFLNKVENEVKK